MFSGSASDNADASGVIERLVPLPRPVETRLFMLEVTDGDAAAVFKLEMVGMLSSERYALNPFLDEQVVDKREFKILGMELEVTSSISTAGKMRTPNFGLRLLVCLQLVSGPSAVIYINQLRVELLLSPYNRLHTIYVEFAFLLNKGIPGF